MMNSLGLGLVFTAKDMATDTIRKVSSHFAQLEKAGGLAGAAAAGGMAAAKIGLLSLGAGAATLAVGMKAAESFTEFEFNLAAVGAVTKSTTEELELLKNAALEAGMKTEFSPTQAVQGLNTLTTAGQTAREAMATLVPVLDLAGASFGKMSVDSAAGAVVGTLNSFGMAADQSTILVDKLVKTTNLTNFAFADFDAGLSTAASSAGVFNQTLDDTLIAMGLLRNRNLDASVAATALRESMRRLGSDAGAQKAVLGAGVKIFDDLTGKMRPVMDITNDMIDVTKDWTEQKRNALVVDAFGARGLLAFAAIQKASFTQSKNGIDVTLKGRDAIAAMRSEMENAAGSAEEFRHKLLDTYQGQLILLKGAKETAAILGGEAFAMVFKPLVSALVGGINRINRAMQQISKPTKMFIGQLILGAGAFLSLVGFVMTTQAAMTLLGISLGGVALAFAKVMLFLAPVLAGIALAVGVFTAFRRAYENNVGGIADSIRSAFAKIKLGVGALVQLFTQGGFSGAVRDDLNKAENGGLKKFVKTVFLFANRIHNFFVGLERGIASTITKAMPAFDNFRRALGQLAKIFGLTSDKIDHAAAKNSFGKWGEAGWEAGELLVRALELVTNTITHMMEFVTGVKRAWDDFASTIKINGGLLDDIAADLDRVSIALGLSGHTAADSGSGWETFGKILGGTVLGLVHTVTSFIDGLVLALQGLSHVLEGISRIVLGVFTASWDEAWFGMKQTAFGVVQAIIAIVFGLARTVGGVFDSLGRMFGKDLGIAAGMDELRTLQKEIGSSLATSMGVTEADRRRLGVTESMVGLGGAPAPVGAPPPTPMTSPAVASSVPASPMMSVAPAVASQAAPQILKATMVMDGRAIGELTANMSRSDADRSAVPVSMSEG